jgi:signal peptidase I
MKINKKIILFCILCISILTFDCWGQPYLIMRTSVMEPTIKEGDIIFVDPSIYETQLPDRWDIVLFRRPTEYYKGPFVMRIAGLPGEVISYDSMGILIDGKRFTPPIPGIIYSAAKDDRVIHHPFPIPENEYYLIGDNVNDAFDSRFLGSIPKENIIGKVTNVW